MKVDVVLNKGGDIKVGVIITFAVFKLQIYVALILYSALELLWKQLLLQEVVVSPLINENLSLWALVFLR